MGKRVTHLAMSGSWGKHPPMGRSPGLTVYTRGVRCGQVKLKASLIHTCAPGLPDAQASDLHQATPHWASALRTPPCSPAKQPAPPRGGALVGPPPCGLSSLMIPRGALPRARSSPLLVSPPGTKKMQKPALSQCEAES